MTRRSELRAEVIERSRGICEWSRCTDPGEQLAHIRGIGRGGNPDGTRDTIDNVAWLCVYHHDLLDGRTDRMRLHEIESLLLELVALRTRPVVPESRIYGLGFPPAETNTTNGGYE